MDQKSQVDMFYEIYIKELILDSDSIIIYQLYNNTDTDLKKELTKKHYMNVQLPAAFITTSNLEFLRKTAWIPVTNNICIAAATSKDITISDFIETTSILTNHSALIIAARYNTIFFDVNRLNNLKANLLAMTKTFTNEPIIYQSVNLPKFNQVMSKFLYLLSKLGNKKLA